MTSRALAVAVVLTRPDGKTLLVRRAAGRPAPGYWTPVTGKVEPGEGLADAAVREAYEETGLRVAVSGELFRGDTVGADYELVWLAARLLPGQDADTLTLSEEIDEARWVGPGETADLTPMFAVTRSFYGRSPSETC